MPALTAANPAPIAPPALAHATSLNKTVSKSIIVCLYLIKKLYFFVRREALMFTTQESRFTSYYHRVIRTNLVFIVMIMHIFNSLSDKYGGKISEDECLYES